MAARAEVRRAGRRAQAKLQRSSQTPGASEPLTYVEEARVVSPVQRVLRRLGAIVLMVVVLGGGGLLMLGLAFDGGKGYQVAPVLALIVAVLFGFPGACVLVAHVRNVWRETAG